MMHTTDRTFADLKAGLPAEERAEMERFAAQASRSLTLRKLREAAGMTQVQVAHELDVKQSHISQLENRADIQVGTLTDYIQALGGELEIVAHIGGKPYTVVIPAMLGWSDKEVAEHGADSAAGDL